MSESIRQESNWYLISIMLLIALSIYSGALSTFIVGAINLCVGAFIINKSRVQCKNLITKLFCFAFCFYTCYAFIEFIEITEYNRHYYPDQIDFFFYFAKECISYNMSLGEIMQAAFQYHMGLVSGIMTYIGLFTWLEYRIDGEFCYLPLLQTTVIIASIYAIFLYKLLSLFEEHKAFKYSLYYVICGPVALYAFVLLRDMHIAFLFLLGIYIILKDPPLVKGVVGLTIIDVLLFSLRFQHGIFFILFIILFLHNKFKNAKIVFWISIICVGFVFSALLIASYDIIEETTVVYTENTIEKANAGGLAMRLLKLPTPIREITCSAFSQIFPFPFWLIDRKIENICDGLILFLMMLRSAFWYFVAFTVAKMLIKKVVFRQCKQFMPLLFIAVMLIVSGSSEYYEIRRFMGVYPIIYLVFFYILNCINIEHNSLRQTKTQAVLLYTALSLIYIIIK